MDKTHTFYDLQKGHICMEYTGTNMSRFRELILDAFPDYNFSRAEMKKKLNRRKPLKYVWANVSDNGDVYVKISADPAVNRDIIEHLKVKTKKDLEFSPQERDDFLAKYAE